MRNKLGFKRTADGAHAVFKIMACNFALGLSAVFANAFFIIIMIACNFAPVFSAK